MEVNFIVEIQIWIIVIKWICRITVIKIKGIEYLIWKMCQVYFCWIWVPEMFSNGIQEFIIIFNMIILQS